MKIIAKKKVIPFKAKAKAKKPVPLPSGKTKPLIKIADKIRGKVLNIKAVEAAKIAPPAAKKTAKESEFEIKKTKIRVVGIGGGGGNIVSEIADRVRRPSFTIANTDAAALRRASKSVSVFQFGENFTRGLGTGMDPRVAEEAAAQEKEKIKKIMEGQDLVIIVASLGGGAGSGAAPVFAQISKSLGNLTYGIFTLPFEFEGEKKKEIAKAALEKSKPYLNALTILPNERVFEVVPKATPFSKTLSFINNSLSDSLEGLIETIYSTGLINIDFADLRAILLGSGKMAFLNTVALKKGEETGVDVFEKVFSSPLYPYGIEKARGLLLNIVAQKDLKLAEVNKILTGAAKRINKDARIIFGVGHEGARESSIRVTILATGCVYAGAGNGNGDDGNDKESLIAPPPAPRAPRKPAPKKTALPPKPAKPMKSSKLTKPAKPAAASQRNKSAPPKLKKVAVRIKSLPPAAKEPQSAPEKQIQDGAGRQSGQGIDAQFAAPERKNALQVKKEIEMEENAMLEQEKVWEVPAFLRKQKKNQN
jgi:cell division protein FtsZ